MSDFTVDRDSTKRVLGSAGTLVSYGTDEPAFEFNADGSYRGLLIEPAATNLCLQSENFSIDWSPSNATPVQSTETTPDGNSTNKYIKLVDDNSGGTGVVRLQQDRNVSANTKYTASIFAKADGLSFFNFTVLNFDGATDGRQYFGLSGAGTLGTAANLDDSSIEAYPNGWYRCSITWTQGVSDTNFVLRIFLASSISSLTVPLDGTSSIFIWGAQVEAGPIATSYIPTTTASVTRAKDDITLGSASSLIGQKATGGTLYIEVDWIRPLGYLLSVSDGTVNNMAIIYNGINQELRMYLNSNSVNLTDQGESHTDYSGIQKFAFAYADNDFELYRNGSSVSSDEVGDLSDLATLFRIDIGQSPGTTATTHAHIRAVAIFDSRLSDAECETLTTI